jgi:hypothetical protein
MQPNTTEQARSTEETVFSRLADSLSIPRLAVITGIPATTLHAYRYGRARLPACHLAKLYRGILSLSGDAGLAAWAFERLSGADAIGHHLTPKAQGLDGDAPVLDALQAAHWLGAVSARLAEFGELDHAEAAVTLPDARRLEVEAGQLRVKLEVIASCTPQRSIPGSEARQ